MTPQQANSLDTRRAELAAEATRINAGRKPKFGDLMRNPWAGETNPHRDGHFVREGRNAGRLNPGRWYEFTDAKGEFWQIPVDCVFFIDAESRAPAPTEPAVDRDAVPSHLLEFVQAVATGYSGLNNQEQAYCYGCEADLDGHEDHKPDCIVLRAQSLLATPASPAVPVADCGPNPVTWQPADVARLDAALHKMFGTPAVPGKPLIWQTLTANAFVGYEEYSTYRREIEGLTRRANATPAVPAPAPLAPIPDVLFDGHAVYKSVMENDPHTPRPTADNISDVLDAIVRLLRASQPTSTPEAVNLLVGEAKRVIGKN